MTQSVNPGQAFTELIWTNPEICNNCFRRCQTTHELEYSGGAGTTHTVRESNHTPDGELGYDVETHDPHGALRTHPPRTTCSNCGSIRLLADADTLSKRELQQAITAIADRLQEAGLEVDTNRMRRFAKLTKRAPAMNDLDREILDAAVYYGLHGAHS